MPLKTPAGNRGPTATGNRGPTATGNRGPTTAANHATTATTNPSPGNRGPTTAANHATTATTNPSPGNRGPTTTANYATTATTNPSPGNEVPPTAPPICIPVNNTGCAAEIEECCETLECGSALPVPPEQDDRLKDLCCVPLGVTGCFPGVRPGKNGCCDNNFCDPNGVCVPCLGAGGIGCNSNDATACCGEELQCALNSPMSRMDENLLRTEARFASDQCCVRNGQLGCTPGEGSTTYCCNYQAVVGGFVCRETEIAGLPGTFLGMCCIPEGLNATINGVIRDEFCCSGTADDSTGECVLRENVNSR